MAKQTINIGSSPNKGDGDPLRDAFDKINDNFTELYTLTGGTAADLKELSQDYVSEMIVNATHSGISVAYNDTANTLSLTGFSGAYADLTGAPSIPADVSDLTDNTSLLFSGDYNDLTNKPSTDLSALGQNLLPATDATYDLGSNTNRFDDVYARKLRSDGFVFFDEEIGGAGQVLSLLKASDNSIATLKADIVGYATETYVNTAVQALDDDLRVGTPGALDSLNELAAAINNDPNFYQTVSSALAAKADASSVPNLDQDLNTTDSVQFVGITATGNANIAGALSVTSNSGFSGTLSVTGDITGASNLSIGGDVSITGNDTVFGNSSVSGNFDVLGNADVSGNLDVIGDVTVSGITYTTQVKSNGQLLINAGGGPTNYVQIGTGSNVLIGQNGKNVEFGTSVTFPDATVQTTAYPGTPTLISSGDTAPGSSVVAGENDVQFNFSDGVSTAVSIDRDGDITGTQDGTISGFARIETTDGNLDIVADNYLRLNSSDNGQIEIGRASGNAHVIIGNTSNGTDVDIEGKLSILGGGVPASSLGASGDVEGLFALDSNYIYYCTDNYDGVTNIWKRVAWSGDTW